MKRSSSQIDEFRDTGFWLPMYDLIRLFLPASSIKQRPSEMAESEGL